MSRFACHECRKKFRTEGALGMHEAAKHKGQRVTVHSHATPAKSARGAFFGSFTGALVAVLLCGAVLLVVTTTNISNAVPAVSKAVHEAVWR